VQLIGAREGLKNVIPSEARDLLFRLGKQILRSLRSLRMTFVWFDTMKVTSV